jgi:type IV pilus assembly protein PilB
LEYRHDITHLHKGVGCEICGRTGYKGRIAIHEVLHIDDTLRSMIIQKRSDSDYKNYGLENGLIPILQDGMDKVAAGETTIVEIYRVAGNE